MLGGAVAPFIIASAQGAFLNLMLSKPGYPLILFRRMYREEGVLGQSGSDFKNEFSDLQQRSIRNVIGDRAPGRQDKPALLHRLYRFLNFALEFNVG